MAVRRSATPTLADVAAEAGVSQATASRALADSPLVNENTRRRVWEVAQRLRFQPNRLARSLRRGRDDGGRPRRAGRRRVVLRERAEERPGRARGGGLPRAGAQHRARRRARARGAAHAARAPGRRAAGRDVRAATRTSACPPSSSTTSRRSAARAPWRWTTTAACGCWSSISSTSTATSGSPTWARRRRSAPAPTACCRARAASGWRPSARPSGAPGCRCRRSTCARASRRASRRTRASRRAS